MQHNMDHFARVNQRERRRADARVFAAGLTAPCLPGLKPGAYTP